MGEKKYDVELGAMEYQALLNNRMISSMFEDDLQKPKKFGEFVTLQMSPSTLDQLAGFTAAEANHATSDEEEELLGSAYESLELALNSIKQWGVTLRTH